MSNPTRDEVGYSIKLPGGVGDKAVLPSMMNSFAQLTGNNFAITFDVCFSDDNHNVFFGGSNGLSHFHLIRNMNDGNIDLILIDAADNHRDYTWSPRLIRGKWYNIIINGTMSGDNGIDLYIDGVLQTVAAQQNDVGYNPTDSMQLSFGDHNGVNLGGLKIANPYLFSSTLSADNIAAIKTRRKYPTFPMGAWKFKRPNIGLTHAISS